MRAPGLAGCCVLAGKGDLWYTFDQGFDEPLKQKRGCTAVRKTWWRVPAYCIAAFVLGSQLVMFLESLGWPMELWPVEMQFLFLGWFLVGGWVFFRHMTQKEILLSASIAAVFQLLLAVALYIYTFLQVKEKLMTDYQNSVDLMESILDMEVVRTGHIRCPCGRSSGMPILGCSSGRSKWECIPTSLFASGKRRRRSRRRMGGGTVGMMGRKRYREKGIVLCCS